MQIRLLSVDEGDAMRKLWWPAPLIAILLGCTSAFASAPKWSTWNPSGAYSVSDTQYINNNSLGSPMGPQELRVNSAGNWDIYTDQPSTTGAVLSYPDEQTLEYVKISSLTRLHAYWNVTVPLGDSKDDYETAFDIWIQDNGNPTDWNNNTELMIWVNNHRHYSPLGNLVGTITTQYDQTFQLWSNGPKDAGNVTYTLVFTRNAYSGTMHILSVFRWLEANGYIPVTAGLNDVEFGWEICSTGGVYQDFKVNDYRLTG